MIVIVGAVLMADDDTAPPIDRVVKLLEEMEKILAEVSDLAQHLKEEDDE